MTESCPTGCVSSLCEYNVDPAGEFRIIGQNSHYGAPHVLELLLHNAGLLNLVVDDVGRSDRAKPAEFHKGLDTIIQQPRELDALESGPTSECTIQDSRASNCFGYRSRLKAATAPNYVAGAPHVINIRSDSIRPGMGAPINNTPRRAENFKERLLTSGQELRPLNSQ